MRKFLASVILVLLLCVNAYADIVYTTDSGNLGLIKLESSTSADLYGTQYTGVVSDSLLGSYWDGNESRVILVDRTAHPELSGDRALIFAPSNLSSPIDSEGEILAGVHNTQGIAGSYNGKSVFFSSGASIHEFRTSGFSVERSYTYTPKTSDDITPTISTILTATYRVYAIARREASSDILLAFDGQIRDDVDSFESVDLPSGTTEISWLSNSRVAASHTDGVSVWGRNGFVSIVSSDAPVMSLCRDGGDGFYFTEGVQSGDTYITTLKHYNYGSGITTLNTGDIGKVNQLVRDESHNVLAAITGSKILLYSIRNDVLIGEYDSTMLEGLPVNIAVTSVSGDDGKTNSGCDISGAGMMMLLAGMIILRRH